KGAQFYLEGHLKLDQWQDKTDGTKRSKIKIVLDDFQFFEARQDGMGGGDGAPRPARMSSPPPARRPAPTAPASNGGNYDVPEPDVVDEPPMGGSEDLPF